MDCPYCKTYNPEDRTVCWRCDKPLPKPEVKQKKQISSQQWLYVIIAVMFLLMALNMCGGPLLQQFQQPKTGLLPSAPAAALLLNVAVTL